MLVLRLKALLVQPSLDRAGVGAKVLAAALLWVILPITAPFAVKAMGLLDAHHMLKEPRIGPRSVPIGASVHTGAPMLASGPERLHDGRSTFPLDLDHDPIALPVATPLHSAHLIARSISDPDSFLERMEALPHVDLIAAGKAEKPTDNAGDIEVRTRGCVRVKADHF
jgi:hypothetical protein